MKRKNFLSLISVIILVGALSILSSCQYDFIELPTPASNDTILFSTQIVPIFNEQENCVACHIDGNQSPFLTPDVAYQEIMNKGEVDVTHPETSPLYSVPNTSSATHTWKKYTAAEAQLILQWIKQGAQNN